MARGDKAILRPAMADTDAGRCRQLQQRCRSDQRDQHCVADAIRRSGRARSGAASMTNTTNAAINFGAGAATLNHHHVPAAGPGTGCSPRRIDDRRRRRRRRAAVNITGTFTTAADLAMQSSGGILCGAPSWRDSSDQHVDESDRRDDSQATTLGLALSMQPRALAFSRLRYLAFDIMAPAGASLLSIFTVLH